VQDAEVRHAQDELDRLRRTLNIPDLDTMSSVPTPTLDVEVVRRLHGELVSYQTMLEKEKAQLAELRKIKPEERYNIITTAIGPDNELGNLLSEMNLAEQRLIAMQREYTAEHPTYLNGKELAADARRRVHARVEGIMTGLSNRVTGLTAALKTVQENLDSARKSDLAKAEATRPYYDAKVRLQDLQNFRKVLSMKVSAEQMDVRLPKSALVSIIDRAVPGVRPVRPNKPFNLFVGACGGMILAVIIGGGAAWLVSLAGRKTPRPPTA